MPVEIPIRKIIHVDMDAFYTSVEQLDRPELRGKAIAVGGSEIRGVVSAASYEARAFGVHSAMTGALAKRKCPELIFVKPRFERYRAISKIIREIFYDFTDLVEPLSLDEAYLDVTTNKKRHPSATVLAEKIREAILRETGLTASAGISINKFMAKIASDINKPNGQKTIPPEDVLPFMEQLDIRKFYGIGAKTAERMYNLGIFTGLDLKQRSLEFLESEFGKSGIHYYHVVRGIYNSPVQSNRKRKSLAAERTFDHNISSEIYLEERLKVIVSELSERLKRSDASGKTITLKIKYSDFSTQTRSRTLNTPTRSHNLILETAKTLLYQDHLKESVRLLGVAVSRLDQEEKDQEKDFYDVQLKLDF